MKVYPSAESLIGNTPLVRLSRLEKKLGVKAKLLAKVEFVNPGGSVKDRVALNMIADAERRGVLAPGATIIEPTSGNTGIGLALVAAVRGYRCVIVMPDTMSVERRQSMAAYGAEVVLCSGGMTGAIAKAEELAREIPGSFLAGQFVNSANAAAHYETTGPEIWRDTEGEVDIFVAGVGTGGTITGTGHYLKKQKESLSVIAVEPETSAVLSGGAAGPHGLQGIGAGFVPKVLDTSVYDTVVPVSDAAAYAAARELCRTEGLMVGISAGAALHAAIEAGKKAENEGKTIVVLLPDTGGRYFSTTLFSE